MCEKYINEYNMKLRKYNERINEIYVELEKIGIIILSDLKNEIESEEINYIEMRKRSMKELIIEYIIKILNEEVK